MTVSPSWMHEKAEAPVTQVTVARRMAGYGVVLGVLVVAVLFLLGIWNPWHLVVLQRWFANPWSGLVIVAIGSYLALWLLAPVRSGARQRGRTRARFAIAAVGFIGLIFWGLFGLLFRYEAEELTRSPDGAWAVADVTAGGLAERELRIWEGDGLATREVGSLGRPCGGLRVIEFVRPDLLVIDQGFGEWEFRLDPQTGRPLDVFGPTCPHGPVPATMGS